MNGYIAKMRVLIQSNSKCKLADRNKSDQHQRVVNSLCNYQINNE
jgi:hypothetical protein